MDGLIISNINDDGHIEISSTNINIQSNYLIFLLMLMLMTYYLHCLQTVVLH